MSGEGPVEYRDFVSLPTRRCPGEPRFDITMLLTIDKWSLTMLLTNEVWQCCWQMKFYPEIKTLSRLIVLSNGIRPLDHKFKSSVHVLNSNTDSNKYLVIFYKVPLIKLLFSWTWYLLHPVINNSKIWWTLESSLLTRLLILVMVLWWLYHYTLLNILKQNLLRKLYSSKLYLGKLSLSRLLLKQTLL